MALFMKIIIAKFDRSRTNLPNPTRIDFRSVRVAFALADRDV
jgi:hypothetical protein